VSSGHCPAFLFAQLGIRSALFAHSQILCCQKCLLLDYPSKSISSGLRIF
jgi:hypothetical protein